MNKTERKKDYSMNNLTFFPTKKKKNRIPDSGVLTIVLSI